MTHIRIRGINAMQACIRQYGIWAAGRMAMKLGVPFADFYWEVFGREPRK